MVSQTFSEFCIGSVSKLVDTLFVVNSWGIIVFNDFSKVLLENHFSHNQLITAVFTVEILSVLLEGIVGKINN
jgi:hypothetical protein